ncbi:hypothetical protein [Rubripirellula reticaptiva]|uniref:Uncharacterized protein n=1 Tax=Rubripirellula reticaptiva TaxID=2528013 RepID=A0A5C6EUI1_9BACT|nr:hypothetical protein [Rubripirellula reticaptiva]TWU51960.1 hypothetical protein Poly59_35570 [Rubripirellula reticaptiva]
MSAIETKDLCCTEVRSAPRMLRSRVASLATIGFGLGISMASAICLDANAEEYHPIERAGRWSGIGWGDGYHACKSSGVGICSDLPPRSYSATFGDQTSRGNAHAHGANRSDRYPTFYDRFDAGQIVECNSVGCATTLCDSAGCDSVRCDSNGCDAVGYGTATRGNEFGYNSPGIESAGRGAVAEYSVERESVARQPAARDASKQLANNGDVFWFGSANQDSVSNPSYEMNFGEHTSRSSDSVPSYASAKIATAVDPILEKSLAMDPGELTLATPEPLQKPMIRPTESKTLLLPPVQQIARQEQEVVKLPITVRSSDSPARIELQVIAENVEATSTRDAIASTAPVRTAVAKPSRLARPTRIPFTQATVEATSDSTGDGMWLKPATNNPFVK